MAYHASQSTCKILLVDDEENILRAISRLLMDEDNLEVLTAPSGESALSALKEDPDVALVLSDQRMPGMSGAELLHQVRQLAPDAVRMVLTGYADIGATMDAINKGGASRYLTKPWDDAALLQAIREGIEHFRLIQENRRLSALVEKQNLELKEWNDSLKSRVMEQTSTIRRQNEELKGKNRQIDAAFRHTIIAFSRLIDLHSSRLQEHTRNVTEISVRTAADLGLDAQELETIRTAALLHDVGIIGIPPELLEKRSAAMTQEELDVFLQHAVRGQAALDVVQELRPAGVIIRHHHERFDGEGFPDCLAGDAIPIGARIIAFADFVDRELGELRGDEAVSAVLAKVAKSLGQELDPLLLPAIQPHLSELYRQPRHLEDVEQELKPKQLVEGMVVTRNLYSGTGLLLLTKGTVLDASKIVAITRYYDIDPPTGGVFTVRGKG